jgi:hypothetical protein
MQTIKHAMQSLAWYIEQDKENYAIVFGATLGGFVGFALLVVVH